MHKIYSTDSLVDAQLIADLLESSRVETVIHGGYLSGAAGELPPGELISLWLVDERDADRARSVISEFELQRKQSPTQRLCPACAETIEGNFSICWRCGESLHT